MSHRERAIPPRPARAVRVAGHTLTPRAPTASQLMEALAHVGHATSTIRVPARRFLHDRRPLPLLDGADARGEQRWWNQRCPRRPRCDDGFACHYVRMRHQFVPNSAASGCSPMSPRTDVRHGASEKVVTTWNTGSADSEGSYRRVPPAWFGPWIRGLRTDRGIGLREVARRAGLSSGYVWSIENGRRLPSAAVAEELAAALGLDGDERKTLHTVSLRDVGRDRDRSQPYRRLEQ